MQWLVVLGSSVLAGLVLTALARGLARRVGLVDSPDGRRKTQTRPIPVAGGLAVLAASLVGLFAAHLVIPDAFGGSDVDRLQLLSLLLAAVLITAVGVWDDARNLRARYKLLGQLAAIAVLIFLGGIRIDGISILGHQFHLGQLAIPFTVFWMLACINALNLIDGMDGLLGTVALIALMSLAMIATMGGQVQTAVIALAMAGAVIGFLWFNLPPASIYMGDSGSMLIGLLIGSLAIVGQLKAQAAVSLGAPVALLVLPMMDTTAAVIRRKLTGRGLATADRGHLHHVLQRHGLTTRRALLLVAILASIASVGALATAALQNDVYALIAVGGVVLTLLSTRLFGHAEWTLLKKRLLAAAKAVWPGPADGQPWQLAVRLQGSADWDQLWADLIHQAEELELASLCLDVNAPALHENYHARWDRRGVVPAESQLWRVELPLIAHGHHLGRVVVSGSREKSSLADMLQRLARIIAEAESRAASLASALAMPRTAASSSLRPNDPILPATVVMSDIAKFGTPTRA